MWPHKPMFWNFRNMISGNTPLEMLTITETAFCDTRHAGKRHITYDFPNNSAEKRADFADYRYYRTE